MSGVEEIVQKDKEIRFHRAALGMQGFVTGVITTLLFGGIAYAINIDSAKEAMNDKLRRSDVCSISAGDLNRDGVEEIEVCHSDGSISLYSKNEDGFYEKLGRLIPAENNGDRK